MARLAESDVGPVADKTVDSHLHQVLHLVPFVDRPGNHEQASGVGFFDHIGVKTLKTRGPDGGPACRQVS